ncbi:phage late control D family protein [Bradyrhizobium sp. USDA 3315]
MEFAEASDRNGAFYVPAFVVKVGGQVLTQDLAIGVSQVEVDLTLGGAGRFSFTVVETYDLERRAFLSGYGKSVLELLKFGAAVEIALGYGDHGKLTPMIRGVVTEISTSFAENGTPELNVAGYDNMFSMTLGKRSQSWAKVSDSDVVNLLAREHNLSTRVEPTKEQHAQIEQNQESDVEFIKKLAARNHYEFFIDPPTGLLSFAPPKDRQAGVVSLRWGESLLSFKPEANLAAQVSSVEVYGWDPQSKKAIVGKAVAGEESGSEGTRTSGGAALQTAIGKGAVLQLRQPVFTEAEARRRAEAVLNDHAKRFLTGEAESIGLPDLLPDRNVAIGNLGVPFSKTYYIQQTIHKIDSNGYRTRFKVKETSL